MRNQNTTITIDALQETMQARYDRFEALHTVAKSLESEMDWRTETDENGEKHAPAEGTYYYNAYKAFEEVRQMVLEEMQKLA